MQGTQIRAVEHPYIHDVVADHRQAFKPETKGEALPLLRINAAEFKDARMDHAAAKQLDPAREAAAWFRTRRTDIDLEAGTVLIREKKRRRDVEESTRRVPLSESLKDRLLQWLAVHPGGPF